MKLFSLQNFSMAFKTMRKYHGLMNTNFVFVKHLKKVNRIVKQL